MRGRRRRSAFALEIAVAIVVMTSSHAARGDGPVCDAQAACLDKDGDGFMPCACAPPTTACDCDDTDPAVFPGAPESCDTPKDRNCNGTPDPCPRKEGCFASTCVPECIPLDDFGCATGSIFSSQPDGRCLCAPNDCSVFGCPPGSTCDDDKKCIANCNEAVRCPVGEVCRGFGCVDPCAGVVCANGAACLGGSCGPSCACPGSSGCPAGETCDLSLATPACVDPACVGVRCASGSRCERGSCVDDCSGVVCPPKRVCRSVVVGDGSHAACVDLCSPDPCANAYVCDWRTGGCTPRPTAEGGLVLPRDEGTELLVRGAGWTCTTGGVARASAATVLASIAIVLLVRTRRRRRS